MIWLAPVVPVAVWLLFWAGEETVLWWRRRRFDRHTAEAINVADPVCRCYICRPIRRGQETVASAVIPPRRKTPPKASPPSTGRRGER